MLKEMELITPLNDLGDRLYRWNSRQRTNRDEEDETMVQEYNQIEAYFDGTSDMEKVELDWCESTSYIATRRGSNRKRSYPHLTVRRGFVVSIVVEDHNFNRSVVDQEPEFSIGFIQYYAGVSFGVLSGRFSYLEEAIC